MLIDNKAKFFRLAVNHQKPNTKKETCQYICCQTSFALFEFFSIDFDHFRLDPPTLNNLDIRSENPRLDLVYIVSLFLENRSFRLKKGKKASLLSIILWSEQIYRYLLALHKLVKEKRIYQRDVPDII